MGILSSSHFYTQILNSHPNRKGNTENRLKNSRFTREMEMSKKRSELKDTEISRWHGDTRYFNEVHLKEWK